MIAPGDRLPDVGLRRLGEKGPEEVELRRLAEGGRMVLFGVPGAFTPTCADTHLPGYLQHADELRRRGVDLLVCVAVNDVYVMDAWRQASGAAGIVEMLADGNGEFTRALGLEADLSAYGMGQRSRRYAALVEDGVVRRLWLEPAGGVTVSGAERVLAALVETAKSAA